MKLIPLSEVSHILQPGIALPWGVRDGKGTLLLAKGSTLVDSKAIDVLLARGVFVDAAEAAGTPKRPDTPQEDESLHSMWVSMEARLGTVLRAQSDPHFLARVYEAISKIMLMANGNVDLLIFLIMRHDHSRMANYGISHSLHAAALSSLLSKRLDWPEAQRRSVVGAALTMNLSMLDLQGRLAVGGVPPPAKKRPPSAATASTAPKCCARRGCPIRYGSMRLNSTTKKWGERVTPTRWNSPRQKHAWCVLLTPLPPNTVRVPGAHPNRPKRPHGICISRAWATSLWDC